MSIKITKVNANNEHDVNGDVFYIEQVQNKISTPFSRGDLKADFTGDDLVTITDKTAGTKLYTDFPIIGFIDADTNAPFTPESFKRFVRNSFFKDANSAPGGGEYFDLATTRNGIAGVNRVTADNSDPANPKIKVMFLAGGIAKMQVGIDGDSLDYGEGASTRDKSWSAQLSADLGNINYGGFANFAVSGQALDNMIADQNAQIIPYFDKLNYADYLLVVGGGINNLAAGNTAEIVYGLIKQYHSVAHAVGIKTVVKTLSYQNKEYGVGVAKIETERIKLNKLLRAGWKDDIGASGLADIGSDPAIGIYSLNINPVYFNADGEHFTDAGYELIKNIIKPAVIAIYSGKTYGTVTPLPNSPAIGNLRHFKADAGFDQASGNWSDSTLSGDVANPVGTKPTIIPNGLNGKPTLLFNNWPLAGSIPTGIAGNSPRTFMAVVKIITDQPSVGANILGLGQNKTSGAGSICDMIIYSGNGLCLHSNGVLIGTNAEQQISLNAFAILSIIYDGTNAVFRINNFVSDPKPYTSAQLISSPLTIGDGHFDLTPLNAEFAEIIIRSDADSEALATNINYLKTKYVL